jgi:hypothetical protein
MDAEPEEFVGQAYSNAPIAGGRAPKSPSSGAVLISTDSKDSGLWLWQGEAPPTPALPRPKSHARQILHRIMPAVGWAGWIALPTGLTLILIAISMMRHPDSPVSVDTPPVAHSSAPSPTAAVSSAPSPTAALPSAPSPTTALSSALSPAAARPIVALPPATLTEAQPDQVQVPPAPPAAKMPARGPEPPVVKGRAQPKLSRSARKTQSSRVRKQPLFPAPGVLTPPPMTWHGDGY